MPQHCSSAHPSVASCMIHISSYAWSAADRTVIQAMCGHARIMHLPLHNDVCSSILYGMHLMPHALDNMVALRWRSLWAPACRAPATQRLILLCCCPQEVVCSFHILCLQVVMLCNFLHTGTTWSPDVWLTFKLAHHPVISTGTRSIFLFDIQLLCRALPSPTCYLPSPQAGS